MLKRVKVTVALTAAASSALLLMASQQALATTAQGAANSPTADVVGVGSDTLQFAADFMADGSPAASVGGLATTGFNAAGNKYRVINYDATGDAVGRALYTHAGGTFYGNAPTTAVVLRAKQQPVEIPDGSSAGIAALLNDTPGATGYQGAPNGSIQYARMSRIIHASEETTCADATHVAGCGTLHPVVIGADNFTIAHRSPSLGGSNAVALSGFQIAQIYECTAGYQFWDDPNIGGTSHTRIIPVLPQTSSGTYSDFNSDITAHYGFNGTYGSCVVPGEEHDPAGITGATSPADAIEPFSPARIALINSGYFANAGVAANQVVGATGTPVDGHAIYSLARNIYITTRDVDVNNATVWQPGGSANWAHVLFVGSSSYVSRATGQANVAAAGFDTSTGYIDCGAGDTNAACPPPS